MSRAALTKLDSKLDEYDVLIAKQTSLIKKMRQAVFFNKELWPSRKGNKAFTAGAYSVTRSVTTSLPGAVFVTLKDCQDKVKVFKIPFKTFRTLPIKDMNVQQRSNHPYPKEPVITYKPKEDSSVTND